MVTDKDRLDVIESRLEKYRNDLASDSPLSREEISYLHGIELAQKVVKEERNNKIG